MDGKCLTEDGSEEPASATALSMLEGVLAGVGPEWFRTVSWGAAGSALTLVMIGSAEEGLLEGRDEFESGRSGDGVVRPPLCCGGRAGGTTDWPVSDVRDLDRWRAEFAMVAVGGALGVLDRSAREGTSEKLDPAERVCRVVWV